MKFYDKTNFHELELPVTPLASFAKQYWLPFIQLGVAQNIKNVEAECGLAVFDDKVVPLLINQNSEHCSMTSPLCYFYLSGAVAYEHHHNSLLRFFFSVVKKLCIIPRALKFDKNIQINQWLLPTNPLLNLTKDELTELLGFLKNKYPDYGIIYKGLVDQYSDSSKSSALALGARLVKMRWLYFWDSKKVNTRSLNKVSAKSASFELTQDIKAAQEVLKLYDLLYRVKHSPFSPNYTLSFFQTLIQSDYYQIFIHDEETKIQAFYFYSNHGPFLGLGIIGYDINFPKTQGLYSSLIHSVVSHQMSMTQPICLGAGSGEFKRQRGAYPLNEYDAVFVNHLPFYRRILWIYFSKSTHSKLMDYFLRQA